MNLSFLSVILAGFFSLFGGHTLVAINHSQAAAAAAGIAPVAMVEAAHPTLSNAPLGSHISQKTLPRHTPVGYLVDLKFAPRSIDVVSSSTLAAALANLRLEFYGHLNGDPGKAALSQQVAAGGNPEAIGGGGAINQLTNASIAAPSISGGNISNTNISASSLTSAGTASLASATVSGTLSVLGSTTLSSSLSVGGNSALTGNLSVGGTLTANSLSVASVSSAGGIVAPVITATDTTATSSFAGLSASGIQAGFATIINAVATTFNASAANITGFTAINATTTNLVAQNATTTNFYAQSASLGALTLGSATTTAWNGFNITAGCFSIGGTCLATPSSLLASANTWSQLQTFTSGASTTNLSVFNNAYFGATATSSFNSKGQLNLADQGSTGSTLITLGGVPLLSASSSAANIFLGLNSGNNITSGNYNSAVGLNALANNTTGSYNSAVGLNALANNTTGTQNTANGVQSLYANTAGSYNTAVGLNALYSNTTGSYNTAVGQGVLQNTTTGSYNIAIGFQTGFGSGGLYYNQGGTLVGYAAGYSLATGSNFNTLFGYQSGYGITTGARNVLLGQSTIPLSYNQVTTGSNNIAIGNDVAVASSTLSNQLVIGNLIYGTGLNGSGLTLSTGYVGIGTTTPYSRLEVWGPDTASTSAFAVVNNASTTEFAVLDNGNATLAGNLIQNSDQRLKTNIQNLSAASSLAAINALNPVTFNWTDPSKDSVPQYGFIAQDVLKIFPNLVSITAPTPLTRDGTLSLNYIDLVSPIVSAMQELAAEIASIQNTIVGFAQSFATQVLTATEGHFSNQLCVGSTCVTPQEFAAMVAASSQSPNSSSGPAATGALPVIKINGDNPAIVQTGATYNDLGATITGPQPDLNLGIKTFLNGTLAIDIVLDTGAAATDTIAYVVTDAQGLTSTSTRMVHVLAPSKQPEPASQSTSGPVIDMGHASSSASSTSQQ